MDFIQRTEKWRLH